MAGVSPSRAPESRAAVGSGHLPALDVVRLVTVICVVAVHATSVLLPPTSVSTGAALTVLHASREVFLLLSAFVLCYSARGLLPDVRRFWKRRFPLVAAPYAVWSAIYLVAGGGLGDPRDVAARYAYDLLTAGAHYHLYFLLLTLQLYLVFPWVMSWLVRHPRRHLLILGVSIGVQLAFTAAVHYRLPAPQPLALWIHHPGSWLPSYQLYVVAGVLAAIHRQAVVAWIRAHPGWVVGAAACSASAALGGYAVDLHLLHMSPVRASEVFQPAVVLESVAGSAAELLIGLWVVDGMDRRWGRRLAGFSDVSFGVYLAHPLLLEAAVAAGLAAWISRLPAAGGLLVVWLGVVPATLIVTTTAIALTRRTPLSLALTGRRQAKPQAEPT